MKVLFQTRADLFTVTGGDTVQVNKTKEYLEREGVAVDISFDLGANLDGYDLVHLFNLNHPRAIYLQALHAKKQNKKIALSSIYWTLKDMGLKQPYFSPTYHESLASKIKRARREILAALHLRSRTTILKDRQHDVARKLGYFGQVGQLVEMADIILPNSQAEFDCLNRDFEQSRKRPYHIVVNGIDIPKTDTVSQENSFFQKYGLSDYVLCIGRLEPRKNQARLLKALRSLERPIVLIGQTYNQEYVRLVKPLLRSQDLHLESWPHEKIEEVLALAAVHALPSYYDTPGLASLEAASFGIPVVVGNCGAEMEYFGDYGRYCDPEDEVSVRAAVMAALEKGPDRQALMRHVRANFSWAMAAKQTKEAYLKVLEGK